MVPTIQCTRTCCGQISKIIIIITKKTTDLIQTGSSNKATKFPPLTQV